MQLAYHRKDLTYEAVMIDLVLMGALNKATVEGFLGRTIPDHLRGPDTAVVKEDKDAGFAVE
jgi:hypothetical protein